MWAAARQRQSLTASFAFICASRSSGLSLRKSGMAAAAPGALFRGFAFTSISSGFCQAKKKTEQTCSEGHNGEKWGATF